MILRWRKMSAISRVRPVSDGNREAESSARGREDDIRNSSLVFEDPSPARYEALNQLVERIRAGETDGMEELYLVFSNGIRFYLFRQLGAQEFDDKLHDTFRLVLQAIRRGELRDPHRLLGFVRTIVRRQVAAHIDRVVHNRPSPADPNPEEAAMFRRRVELSRRVLAELSDRDREILTRFYLLEEGQDQICSEMSLMNTQFRLIKSRAKARFGALDKRS